MFRFLLLLSSLIIWKHIYSQNSLYLTKMAKHKSKNQLNGQRIGLALGIVFALYLLLVALASKFFGWGTPVVHLISSMYIGYGTTVQGMLMGMLWGFIDFFIAGFIFAWVYNKLGK